MESDSSSTSTPAAAPTGTMDLDVFGPAMKNLGHEDENYATPGPLADFLWVYDEEPHCSRRRQILKKYPQIQRLFGYEWKTKYITMLVVALQFFMAISLRHHVGTIPWWLAVYFIGATANHALFLAIHEITHNLAFRSMLANKLMAIVANLPILVPYSVQFKLYHHDHHKNQGVDGTDTDIPTRLEGLVFQNVLFKALFCFTQILFYALRPIMVKRQPLSFILLVNWLAIILSSGVLYHFYGLGPFYYLFASSFLAGSLHPCAGHFIAEHYVFVKGYETYSYYGPLNYLCFNVGYHNEHHDFPNIPWSRLPLLRKMAPEFYENLPYHKSWPRVIYNFIMDPRVSSFSRVKRPAKYDKHD